jgi:hypothetical protein
MPDTAFAKRRLISRHRQDYARKAEWILREYGAVIGTSVYAKRHQARWAARYLIGLLVDLGAYSRHELCEHTDRKNDGWMWTVERLAEPNPLIRPSRTARC